MNYNLNTFLGISELSNDEQKLIRNYMLIMNLTSFFQHLSTTFIILFAIDTLGYTYAGLFASVILFTQVLFDYPTGSLADRIGPRWVLTFAYIFYGISFFLLSVVNNFYEFIVIGIVIGLAQAQASGTIETWLDNNYKIVSEDRDPEKKIFGFSVSRTSTLTILPSVTAFILGGLLATTYSRKLVFSLQSIFSLVIIFMMANKQYQMLINPRLNRN